MKKEYRLLKNKDFKNVLDERKSVACGEFIVYKKKNELNHARIGISVSSKIGNSVVRHKVKRQISEMIREIFELEGANPYARRIEFYDNKEVLGYLEYSHIYDRIELDNIYVNEEKREFPETNVNCNTPNRWQSKSPENK